ncbi:MAG: ASKHA domain-containing protein [Thermoguttaceae bacterium]|nr:ASKHA domain-containing protein [Thermoguttaceae bacterium]
MKSCRVRIAVDNFGASREGKSELDTMNIVVTPGISLAELLVCHGFKIRQECGGHGTCGQCRSRVAVVEEESIRKTQVEVSYNVNDPVPVLNFRQRLLCQTIVDSDMIVLLPASCFPDGKKSPITFENESGQKQSGQNANGHALGVAVDLGTTTLVVSLLDLTTKTVLNRATCRNPQIETGADIITRIQYATSSLSHAQRMQALATDRIDEMIVALTQRCGLLLENISNVFVSGNTAMTWFFCGLDTACLGVWPFQPPFKTIVPGMNAPKVRLPSCADAEVEIVPVFAGFVGGDIVAGILSLKKELPDVSGPTLYLDLGTNGEMALITGDEIFVAATAAGPAFEGAGIRFGMTAGNGAIEGVDFSDAPYWLGGQKSSSSLLVDGGMTPQGICGSGLIDAVAELIRFGVIDRSGRFRDPAHLRFSKDQPPVLAMFSRLGLFEGHKAFRLTEESPEKSPKESTGIWLTQGDIRSLQLAVGALRAGTGILLRQASLEEADLKHVYLAGLFGSHVRLDNAQAIGLLPRAVPCDRFVYCGNGALRGTEEYAFDPALRAQAADLVERVRHIDLAAEDDFQNVFIDSLVFP